MAQEFKFGDRVRHPDFETECVFIRQWYDSETKEKTWAEVFVNDEYEDTTRLVTHEPLELIPHPDTVRLDWLLKQPNYTYPGNGYDDEGEPIEGVVLWQEYNMGDSARGIGRGKDARAAIDDAMKREQA